MVPVDSSCRLTVMLSLPKGHDQSSTLVQHSVELTLPNHHPFHRDLLRYAKLMEWLKNTDYAKYEGLTKVCEVLSQPQGMLTVCTL